LIPQFIKGKALKRLYHKDDVKLKNIFSATDLISVSPGGG